MTPRGPFYTNWGPLDGPIGRDESPALGVLADRLPYRIDWV